MNEITTAGGEVFAGTGKNGIDEGTREKLLDLSTSNREVLDLVQQKFGQEELTPLQQQELQYLFSVRQQKTSLISNVLRSLFDSISTVVRNFRL